MKINEAKQNVLFGTSPDGFIPSMAIANYLIDKHRILIVGDFTKRDYSILSSLGKEVHVIDIVPLEGIERFYFQSITEKTSFKDKYFDGVVLAEVIEHLFEDYVALQEIHRILKDNGTLVVTVPYFSNIQDKPEYHVRVHSNKTIDRLLRHCGFSIEEHFYRGLMSRLPQKNKVTKYFTFGVRKLLIKIFGINGESIYRRWFFNIEKTLGSIRIFTTIQKSCTSFGGIMKVKKNSKTDFMAVQVNEFTPSSCKSSVNK